MPTTLKVCTFNMRCRTPHDGDNIFDNRTGRISDFINETSPDIIGFQEVTDFMRDWLKANLKDYTVLGCGRNPNYTGEATAIAFKTADFDLISYDTFWLSLTPDVPGSNYGIDQSTCPRLATVAKLKKSDDTAPFYFYNTHLDHKGAMARLLGSAQIIQKISENGGNFIVTGDFNAYPDSPEIKAFTESGITDCTSPIATTFHDYGRLTRNSKIDYVFTNMKCDESLSYAQEDNGVNGIYISDHYPVVAFVELD